MEKRDVVRNRSLFLWVALLLIGVITIQYWSDASTSPLSGQQTAIARTYLAPNQRIPVPVTCGDYTCSPNENEQNCPKDCRLPRILYRQIMSGSHLQRLHLAICNDSDCSNPLKKTITIPPLTSVGEAGSEDFALDAQNRPIIITTARPYWNSPQQSLYFIRCDDPTCSTYTPRFIISVPNYWIAGVSVVILNDGLPFFTYSTQSTFAGSTIFYAVKCNDQNCITFNTVVIFSNGFDALENARMTLNRNGDAVILYAWRDPTNQYNLMVTTCTPNLVCATKTPISGIGPAWDGYSIAIPNDNIPIIAYHYIFSGQYFIQKCSDALCGGTTSYTYNTGTYPDIIVDTNGLPLFSSWTNTGLPSDVISITKCANPLCTPPHSYWNALSYYPLTGGGYTLINNDGHPFHAFTNAGYAAYAIRCTNSDCTARNIHLIDGNTGDAFEIARVRR